MGKRSHFRQKQMLDPGSMSSTASGIKASRYALHDHHVPCIVRKLIRLRASCAVEQIETRLECLVRLLQRIAAMDQSDTSRDLVNWTSRDGAYWSDTKPDRIVRKVQPKP